MKNPTKIIAFTSILIILSCSMDTLLTQRLHSMTHGEIGVWNKIMKGEINADILISGDSRALTSLDCQIISSRTRYSCYNIAFNGNLIDLQLARLKLYIKNNKYPKIIVQVLGMDTLGRSTPYFPLQFLPFLDHEELYATLMQTQQAHVFIKAKYIPLFGLLYFRKQYSLNILDDLYSHDPQDMRINGYRPADVVWDIDEKEFKAQHSKGISGGFDEQGVKALSAMITFCKDNHIRFVLVVAPMYVEGRHYLLNKDIFLPLYEEIADENQVHFLNYFDSEITNHRKYFYNFQHTNIDGAEVFSRMFAEDLNKILSDSF